MNEEIAINRILNNEKYKSLMARIEELEIGRRYCLHGIEHSLDVARIAYIMCLEERLPITKDEVYAAALLHDIGRASEYEEKLPHHEQSALIARKILGECNYDGIFSEKEIDEICEAINSHKQLQVADSSLKTILYKADKLSRNCFACKSFDDCYWSDDVKNHGITY